MSEPQFSTIYRCFGGVLPWSLNSLPLKSYLPSRKAVFQPPVFRSYVLCETSGGQLECKEGGCIRIASWENWRLMIVHGQMTPTKTHKIQKSSTLDMNIPMLLETTLAKQVIWYLIHIWHLPWFLQRFIDTNIPASKLDVYHQKVWAKLNRPDGIWCSLTGGICE